MPVDSSISDLNKEVDVPQNPSRRNLFTSGAAALGATLLPAKRSYQPFITGACGACLGVLIGVFGANTVGL